MGTGPQSNFETRTEQQPNLKALQNGGDGKEGERGESGTQYYWVFVCEGLAECIVCRHLCSWGSQSECHRPGSYICVILLSSCGSRAISGPVSWSLRPADDSFAVLKLTGHQERALPRSYGSLRGLLEHCNNIQGIWPVDFSASASTRAVPSLGTLRSMSPKHDGDLWKVFPLLPWLCLILKSTPFKTHPKHPVLWDTNLGSFQVKKTCLLTSYDSRSPQLMDSLPVPYPSCGLCEHLPIVSGMGLEAILKHVFFSPWKEMLLTIV